MSEEKKEPAETPALPPKETATPPVAPPVDGPKKILQELEKSAAAEAPTSTLPPTPSAELKPEEKPVPPATPEIPAKSTEEPAPIAAALPTEASPISTQEIKSPDPAAPLETLVTAVFEEKPPLITDAMRRLDDLLARFRQSSDPTPPA